MSRNLTTVITANGEVLTNEEATVYMHDLELVVTVQNLEDNPAVLSQGKLCEDHGHSYEWASGQKPHTFSNMAQKNPMQHGKLCTNRCPKDYQSVLPVRVQAHLPHRYGRTRLMSPHQVQQTTRRRSTSISVLGSQLRDPTETQNTNEKNGHRTGTGKFTARLVRVVGGVHRKSGRRRSVGIKGHARKQFS